MGFPPPRMKSPRKKEDLEVKKAIAILESLELMTKEQQILYEDIGEALLKYYKNGVGTISMDDVKVELFHPKGEWRKMSFWFKVVK